MPFGKSGYSQCIEAHDGEEALSKAKKEKLTLSSWIRFRSEAGSIIATFRMWFRRPNLNTTPRFHRQYRRSRDSRVCAPWTGRVSRDAGTGARSSSRVDSSFLGARQPKLRSFPENESFFLENQGLFAFGGAGAGAVRGRGQHPSPLLQSPDRSRARARGHTRRRRRLTGRSAPSAWEC